MRDLLGTCPPLEPMRWPRVRIKDVLLPLGEVDADQPLASALDGRDIKGRADGHDGADAPRWLQDAPQNTPNRDPAVEGNCEWQQDGPIWPQEAPGGSHKAFRTPPEAPNKAQETFEGTPEPPQGWASAKK